MGVGSDPVRAKLPATPWGCLPPRMRVLFITGQHRTGGWLAESLAADSASEVLLEEVLGIAAGLARLRDELFDAVLISHDGHSLDALEILDAIRTGSSDEQPIIVLGEQSEQEMADLCFESGADAYLCAGNSTTRTLIWQVARATERHRLISDNRRLEQEYRHRLRLEEGEAIRQIEQQRGLVASCVDIDRGAETDGKEAEQPIPQTCSLPRSLRTHYRELLRAYVVMGSGNLSDEMRALAHLLVTNRVTAADAMQLHLIVLGDMIRGLGSRSARHVLNRANLLILEMMISLADGYRKQAPDHQHPSRHQMSPGIEVAA
jgi:CheY-like chemotaxis protein